MPAVKPLDLNDKQKKFCIEYVKDFNATQAAIRAGYSEKTAYSIGSENLTKPEIQQFIKLKTQKVEDEYDLSRETIAKKYAQLVHFDIRKLYDEFGQLKPIHELDDDTVTAITGIEVDEDENWAGVKTRTKKFKTSGIKEALDAVARFNGYNMPDKVEQSGKIETSVIIKRG